jgi:hypothetical protein
VLLESLIRLGYIERVVSKVCICTHAVEWSWRYKICGLILPLLNQLLGITELIDAKRVLVVVNIRKPFNLPSLNLKLIKIFF